MFRTELGSSEFGTELGRLGVFVVGQRWGVVSLGIELGNLGVFCFGTDLGSSEFRD